MLAAGAATCLASTARAEPDAASARVIAALSRAPLPDFPTEYVTRPLDLTCDDAGLTKALALIDAGRLADVPGAVKLAAASHRCRWSEGGAGKELLAHYAAAAREPVALATVSAAFGGITAEDYRSFAKDFIGKMTPNGMKLNLTTAAVSVDLAVGNCTASITRSCVRAEFSRILPQGWSLDAEASIAFGDLFDAPVPEITESEADAAVQPLITSAMPIRSDLLAAISGPRLDELNSGRDQYYQSHYGKSEGL